MLAWSFGFLSFLGVIFYLLKILMLGQVFLVEAKKITNAEILAYGEFVNWQQGSPAPNEPRTEPRIDVQASIVAARLGGAFGIEFKVEADPHPSRVPVTFRIEHPRFEEAPLLSKKTEDEWEGSLISGEKAEIAWFFEYPYELTPGQWRFSVIHDQNTLLSQEFTVVMETPAGNQTNLTEEQL